MGDLRGLGTVFCLVAFLAIVWWAYSPRRKKQFESASRIPFSASELSAEEDPDHD